MYEESSRFQVSMLGFSVCKCDFSILEHLCKSRVSSSETSGCGGALHHVGMAHRLGHMQLGEGSEEATGEVVRGREEEKEISYTLMFFVVDYVPVAVSC